METIRRIEDGDFKAVSALYKGRKSVKELKWLLTDPDHLNQYNAFVAEKEDKSIIGVIGYSLSIYIQNKKSIKGVIPMNWKVIDHYKGMAGVLLFKKVLSLGKFSIAISGSKTAQDLYSLFKYQFKGNITQYYKILDFFTMIKHYKRKSAIKTYGMIAKISPSFFKNNSSNTEKSIKLIPYNGENFPVVSINQSAFGKKITKNYIDWLLKCPKVNAKAYNITIDSKEYGTCILYIYNKGEMKSGRIVHLPFLSNNKQLWKEIIIQCSIILKEEGCALVTGLALNDLNKNGYKNSGFIEIKKHAKPLFIKDSKNKLETFNIENWFLQYSEGDKGYRNF